MSSGDRGCPKGWLSFPVFVTSRAFVFLDYSGAVLFLSMDPLVVLTDAGYCGDGMFGW